MFYLTVLGNRLSVLSYNVRKPDIFQTQVPSVETYFLLDYEYTGCICGDYMKNGKGKLADGIFEQEFLPSQNVLSSDSNWLSWVFKHADPVRKLDVYFKFDEDKLIDSVSINVLSQVMSPNVAAYIYSKVHLWLLASNNRTYLSKRIQKIENPTWIGVHTLQMSVRSCQPVQIVRMTFEAEKNAQLLILGEIQFNGEPGE